MNEPVQTIHATALIIGECGLLIRGKSGAGKSSLALQLIDAATSRGLFAQLVSDDRVRLSVTHNNLMAHVHPEIAGKIELYGVGIITIPYVKTCILRAVIDIMDEIPRYPALQNEMIELSGINLYHLNLCYKNSSVHTVFYALKAQGLL